MYLSSMLWKPKIVYLLYSTECQNLSTPNGRQALLQHMLSKFVWTLLFKYVTANRKKESFDSKISILFTKITNRHSMKTSHLQWTNGPVEAEDKNWQWMWECLYDKLEKWSTKVHHFAYVRKTQQFSQKNQSENVFTETPDWTPMNFFQVSRKI